MERSDVYAVRCFDCTEFLMLCPLSSVLANAGEFCVRFVSTIPSVIVSSMGKLIERMEQRYLSNGERINVFTD